MAAARFTIEELAHRAGSSTRNIRNYQTRGLLPPPQVVNRVGWYDEDHLARLRLIGRLQEQGYSLAAIAHLCRAWEEGQSLADLLGFARALAEPWSDDVPEKLTLADLAELFADADPALRQRAVELGLLVPDEDGFRAPIPGAVRAGAELAAVGVPVSAALDEFEDLRGDAERIAARVVALYFDHVWTPFVDEGMPPERLPEMTEALQRMRPLATMAVVSVLAAEMERAVAAAAAEHLVSDTPSGAEAS